MKKTIEQHEEVNLHIKKSTFYAILRSLYVIPIGLYFMISIWIPITLLQLPITAWTLGSIMGNALTTALVIYLTCSAIAGRWLE